jgi:hypothetical protein
VLEQCGCGSISFNPITGPTLAKALAAIAEAEGYSLEAAVAQGLVAGAGGDLRNGIQNLQLLLQGPGAVRLQPGKKGKVRQKGVCLCGGRGDCVVGTRAQPANRSEQDRLCAGFRRWGCGGGEKGGQSEAVRGTQVRVLKLGGWEGAGEWEGGRARYVPQVHLCGAPVCLHVITAASISNATAVYQMSLAAVWVPYCCRAPRPSDAPARARQMPARLLLLLLPVMLCRLV